MTRAGLIRSVATAIVALVFAAGGLGLGLGCGKTGLGDNVRKDIAARMQTVQDPITGCYRDALQRDRKLRGQMVVSFSATAKTGQFQDVRVTRNDLRDPELDRCVIEQVSSLALAQPQKTTVSASYPLDFAPTN